MPLPLSSSLWLITGNLADLEHLAGALEIAGHSRGEV
jgi:hypothetical protein